MCWLAVILFVILTPSLGVSRIGDTEEMASQRYGKFHDWSEPSPITNYKRIKLGEPMCKEPFPEWCWHNTEDKSTGNTYSFELGFHKGICWIVKIKRCWIGWDDALDELEIFVKKNLGDTFEKSVDGKSGNITFLSASGKKVAVYLKKDNILQILSLQEAKEYSDYSESEKQKQLQNSLKDKY